MEKILAGNGDDFNFTTMTLWFISFLVSSNPLTVFRYFVRYLYVNRGYNYSMLWFH